MSNLTIIVPVRKMSGRLDALYSAISSALNSEIKVIVIHDKADDDTEVELREIKKKLDNRNFELITGEFNSPGKARNEGIIRTTSEWVTFWDADDRPVVSNLLKLLEVVRTTNSDIGVGAFQNVWFSNPEKSTENQTHMKGLNFLAATPGIWRMIIRTGIVSEHLFHDYLLAEDQVILSDFVLTSRKITLSRLVVYHYVSGGPSSLTGNHKKTDDLIRSTAHILANIEKSDSDAQKQFDWILVGLQTVSLIKYGSLANRLYAIKLLYKFYAQAPWKSKKMVLRKIFKVGDR